jgi:cytochrome c-type biogenesis protein CcmE
MKPRHLRLAGWLTVLALLGLATALVLRSFEQNLVFFFTPTQLANGEAPAAQRLRLGGMVVKGSLQREGSNVHFDVTDGKRQVAVRYVGLLPDLFQEGKGVVAQGKFGDGRFVADEVLAKHDENYMPPEAAQAIDKAHKDRGMSLPTLSNAK